MENQGNQGKINYNFGGFKKVGEVTCGYITGLMVEGKNNDGTKKPLIEEKIVNVKGEDRKVCSVLLSTTQAKSKMKRNFGDAFEKEQHFIKVTFWGNVAERFLKATKNQKCVLGLFGGLKVVSNSYNGTEYKKVEMTAEDFQIVKRLNGNATSVETGSDEIGAVASGDMPF